MTLRREHDTAIADFTQSIGLLVRRIRATADASDLSWSEAAILKRLATEGPSTTAELARWHGMRPQSMRTVVASLEELGMIGRRPHETDGRQVVLELTEKGLATQKTLGEAKRTWLAEAVGELNDEERETLFTAGRILRRMAGR